MSYNGRVILCKYNYPSAETIERKLEELGYIFYYPKSLLKDLIYFYVYNMLGKPIKYTRSQLDFDKQVISFLKSIPIHLVFGNSPLERAVETLRMYVDKINYRSFDQQIFINIVTPVVNNKITKSSIEKYNILSDEITPELYKQLELSDIICNFVNLKKLKSCNKKWTNLTSYTEILKGKYSSFVRPDFKNKLVNKTFLVKSKKALFTEKQLVFVEDVSSSMKIYKNKIQAVYYALSTVQENIQYYQVHSKIINKGLFTGDNFLNQEITYYTVDYDMNKTLLELENYHRSDNVIFVFLTDQSHYIRSLSLIKTWNFIFLNGVNSKLALLSNGKSITI